MSTELNGTSHESSFPASGRVYKVGQQSGVRVPFRQIRQHVTRTLNESIEVNDPVYVYDTSGPWGDPVYQGDVRDGLPPLRREWILS